MKAEKILTAFCSAVLIGGVSLMPVGAQEKDIVKSSNALAAEKNIEPVPLAGDQTGDNQIAAKRSAVERYRIGFQDAVQVQVFKHDELSQTVNVSADGTIRMPRIDEPILAVCKTERELGEAITKKYSTYLRTPFVTVRVVDQKSQPFAVIGAVEKPGSFYLNRRVRLLELLAFAGGPKIEKAGSKIQVARVGNSLACSEENIQPDNDEIQFLSFKLKDVIDGKENPFMEPGDIVSILEAEEAFVVGKVVKPTRISLKEPVTLTTAIASAGGLEPNAKTDKVIIQRQEPGNPNKTELVFNLKDIADQKIPDPQLQANDIVEVSNDKIKSVRDKVVQVFTNGLPSLFYRIP